MLDEKIVVKLEKETDEKLRYIIANNPVLIEDIILSDPIYSEENGFEPFSSEWIKRYFRNLLSDITNKSMDDALSWALAASVYDVSLKIIDHFGVNVMDYPAAVALAILLIRSAKNSK